MMLKTSGEVATATQHFDGTTFRPFMDKSDGKLKLASTQYDPGADRPIDISWLPAASTKYKISANIRDYILTEVPIITVDVPNRNMDCFPKQAVLEWNDDVGRIAYQTFIGKPAHKDHDNKIPERAKGVIFDARLVQHPVTGRLKIHILKGWDRTKDRPLVELIASGKRPGHSMGCMVGYTQCSYPGCGASDPEGRIKCAHMREGMGKGMIVNGFVLHERCFALNFVESSSVGDPADHDANQRKVWGGM